MSPQVNECSRRVTLRRAVCRLRLRIGGDFPLFSGRYVGFPAGQTCDHPCETQSGLGDHLRPPANRHGLRRILGRVEFLRIFRSDGL
jgi:hypothetical protein